MDEKKGVTKSEFKNSLISSNIVKDILFKILRVYTQTIPHNVPNPCINYISISDSALDVSGCVDELTFLIEQSVAEMKQYAITIAYDLIQCGVLTEQIILNLEDDQGLRLVQDEEESESETELLETTDTPSNDDIEMKGDELTDETAATALKKREDAQSELILKYDRIKLAMARKLVSFIHQEAAEERSGRHDWHEKIFTALDLNGVDHVQPWLEKMAAVVKGDESVFENQSSKWKVPEDIGLSAPTEYRLTTQEIWDEIHTTLVDNLIVDRGVIEDLSSMYIINQHNRLNLLSLPHRKSKVEYLINHIQNMGSTVMYMFGQILEKNNQNHLGRIVVKRLDDNKVHYNVTSC